MSLLVFTKLKSLKHNSHLVTVLKTQNNNFPKYRVVKTRREFISSQTKCCYIYALKINNIYKNAKRIREAITWDMRYEICFPGTDIRAEWCCQHVIKHFFLSHTLSQLSPALFSPHSLWLLSGVVCVCLLRGIWDRMTEWIIRQRHTKRVKISNIERAIDKLGN